MEFNILGPLEVRGTDGSIPLGGAKPRAVLAVLLLNPNEPVSADRLALALWGADAPGAAVKTVQVHVSRLRKSLGDGDAVTTTAAGYSLRVRPGERDVERFDDLVARGRRALADDRAAEAAALLREALRLWRGAPLGDLAGAPFAAGEVRALEEARIAALACRVEADAAAGRHAELVGELRGLVAEHPTHEGFAAQLMLALYRCGRQAEALDAYQEARDRLVGELGVEPGSELRDLQEAILQQDPKLNPLPAELPDELAAAARPTIVGRTAELKWLLERWERAAAGRGTLVLLSGPSGMGRTRLAAELAEEVHRRGDAVVYASAAGPPPGVARALDRARTAARRTLLVLDDFDAADADAKRALDTLVESLAPLPVLVLTVATASAALDGTPPDASIELGPLAVEAVRAIAATFAPGVDPEEIPAELLLAAAQGIPARIHEVAAEWARDEAERRLGALVGEAAAGRARLRSMEDELAGDVALLRRSARTAAEPGGRVICPFKGLASFEAADADFFCGRERLVADLVAQLVGAPLLGVVGPSGSGKSSVVRAGLLPALASGTLPGSEEWPLLLMRPGEHPCEELDRVTANARGRFVLAVDQCEEMFTACRDEAERNRFATRLSDLAQGAEGPSVVVALRADFYGRCAAYPTLARLLAANHALVGAMRRAELRSAIVDPAERAGLFVEPELADTLVADVEHQPGALPLLSTALLELWQRRDGTRLRLSTYEETGGVLGAVGRLAEAAFAQLDAAQQAVARTVLLRLAEVEPEGGVERRRLPLAELEASGDRAVAWVIARLADARLLTVSSGTVEFAHEALLREWPRLRAWIEDDREDLKLHRNLSFAASEWTRLDRDESALYTGARLAEAQNWAERGDPGPTAPEREFLAASAERARRARRGHRRRLGFAFGALALGVVAIAIVAIVALYQGREAERQRDIAASRELAASATRFLDVDPGLSVALALEALQRRDTEQAESALRQATLASRAVSAWPAHKGWVHSVEASRDGRRAVTAGRDGAVSIWDLEHGRREWTVEAHPGRWALGASLSPDGRDVASVGDDGIIAIWDVATKHKRVLAHLSAPNYATGVQYSHDGKSVIVPVIDGTVRVLPVSGDGSVTVLRGHAGTVRSAHFSPDDTKALSTGEDRTARIWDLASGASTVLPHPEAVGGGAFSPDGQHVATAAADGVVRIWDVSGRGLPLRIPSDEQQLYSVAFSGDGRRLVTTGEDGVVRIWDARGGPVLGELQGHKGLVLAAAFVPGTQTIVSVGEDGTLRRWAPAAAAVVQAPVTGASFASDDQQVLSGGVDGVVRIWDSSSGSMRRLRGHTAPSFAQFSPGDRRIASASYDGTVRLWDTKTGRSKVVFSGKTPLFTAAFDPAGRRLAIAGGPPYIVLERLDGGDRVVLRGHRGVVQDVEFSPDGEHVASASDDGTVRLWDAASGNLERTLKGHAQSVRSVSYSPDGRSVVSAGADGTVRIWSMDGDRSVVLRGHEGPVSSAAFSPDGDRVVSAGQDGTVRIWSVAGGETLAVVYTHQGSASAAQFSSDGQKIVSAGDQGVIRVSSCEVCGSLRSVLRLARTRVERKLSAIERRQLLPRDD